MATKRYIKVHFYVLPEEYRQLKKSIGSGNLSVWFRNVLHVYLQQDQEKLDEVRRQINIEKGIWED